MSPQGQLFVALTLTLTFGLKVPGLGLGLDPKGSGLELITDAMCVQVGLVLLVTAGVSLMRVYVTVEYCSSLSPFTCLLLSSTVPSVLNVILMFVLSEVRTLMTLLCLFGRRLLIFTRGKWT